MVSRLHEGFSALPAVVTELKGIIKDGSLKDSEGVVSGTVLLDEAFTAESMRQALRGQPSMVHLASHYQLRPGNEAESFLLLGDGTRLSLAQLKTWPEGFEGVEVLTLSACDTAMGGVGANGKEVEGFGVLAQRKGARAVVATLWPVADESTQALMWAFYRFRETQSGTPKIEALRQAQLALLRGQVKKSASDNQRGIGEARSVEPRTEQESPPPPKFTPDPRAPYAHPYYWAPFILIGN